MAIKQNKLNIGFNYAWQGIKWVVANERNMRIHLVFLVLVLAAGLFFGVSRVEAIVLALVVTLVLMGEMLNSAIEQVVDLCVGTSFHPLAQRSKDIAAGAVLLAAICSVIVGVIIFLPKILEKF